MVPSGQDYDQLVNDTESGKNLKVCPVKTPFFDGENCIDCELGQVFNMGTSSCEECPEFKVFNKETHSCDEQPMISNTKNYNWIAEDGKQLEEENEAAVGNGTAECPKDKPYSVGTSCIACENDEVFDADSKSCSTCPDDKVIDMHNHVCIEPTLFVTNPEKAPLLIYDGIAPA